MVACESRSADMAGFANAHEVAALNEMREIFSAEISSMQSSGWLTDACICRYLRARKWNVKQAEKMLRASLEWRLDFKPEQIKWSDVQEEALTGKMYVSERFDRQGRPIVYMKPAKENTKSHEGQIKYLVYTLETALRMSAKSFADVDQPRGSCDDVAPEQLCIVIDYANWSLSKAPPMKTSAETVTILQNHYPERLGKAILINAPTMFSVFWAMVSPFVDNDTKSKMLFASSSRKRRKQELSEHIDLCHLEHEVGGDWQYDFSHQAYEQMVIPLEGSTVAAAVPS
mmetsp:Transcript_30503/g.58733  ORF Transcript_30503/g.58733 Transcript_30503/m.58733 type:complete len:286 (-) Transcript_30503:241-1098(-)